MKYLKISLLFFFLGLLSCSQSKEKQAKPENTKETSVTPDFVIAFGSCNKQNAKNELWKEILKNRPNIWIWGGDNIYSDTEDMNKMAYDYQVQLSQKGYQDLRSQVDILGTWDDHDYGANDAGIEYAQKEASQQLFLDFMRVDKNDPRRLREGIYHSKTYTTNGGSVKVIILDTRYFRDSIERIDGVYQPNETGSILGETQWEWFSNELMNSEADFNIIVSSIQVISSEHRFEKWANFPNEVKRFYSVIGNSNAKGILVVSGDRHISEFSKKEVNGLNYPLVDFTSSGLTHSSTHFSGEPNTYRVLNVIKSKSFGLLKFNFNSKQIHMEMRGINNELLQEYNQSYP